jgi:phosphoserine phosphatase
LSTDHRRFNTVIFDCDSTLTAIEGIEELARAQREEITRLTELAMRGAVPLEQVYGHRLELIRPSQSDIAEVGRLYLRHLVPGVRETIRALQVDGVTVQILSGGLAPAVLVVGRELGVPDSLVAAVDVYFNSDGSYRGFDNNSPLTRSGGKRTWIEASGLSRPRLLIGDGATDLEARPAVDCFAAFVGVVDRPEVSRAADVVLRDISLEPMLKLVRGS